MGLGYLFGGPHNKDYKILGSILGYPHFGKLAYIAFTYIYEESRHGSYVGKVGIGKFMCRLPSTLLKIKGYMRDYCT